MRVDNSNPPPEMRVRETEAVRPSQETAGSRGTTNVERADSVEFSRLAAAVKSLSLRIVADDTAIRSIRLQELKEAVRNGSFNPDPRDTAQAMLDHPTD